MCDECAARQRVRAVDASREWFPYRVLDPNSCPHPHSSCALPTYDAPFTSRPPDYPPARPPRPSLVLTTHSLSHTRTHSPSPRVLCALRVQSVFAAETRETLRGHVARMCNILFFTKFTDTHYYSEDSWVYYTALNCITTTFLYNTVLLYEYFHFISFRFIHFIFSYVVFIRFSAQCLSLLEFSV